MISNTGKALNQWQGKKEKIISYCGNQNWTCWQSLQTFVDNRDILSLKKIEDEINIAFKSPETSLTLRRELVNALIILDDEETINAALLNKNIQLFHKEIILSTLFHKKYFGPIIKIVKDIPSLNPQYNDNLYFPALNCLVDPQNLEILNDLKNDLIKMYELRPILINSNNTISEKIDELFLPYSPSNLYVPHKKTVPYSLAELALEALGLLESKEYFKQKRCDLIGDLSNINSVGIKHNTVKALLIIDGKEDIRAFLTADIDMNWKASVLGSLKILKQDAFVEEILVGDYRRYLKQEALDYFINKRMDTVLKRNKETIFQIAQQFPKDIISSYAVRALVRIKATKEIAQIAKNPKQSKYVNTMANKYLIASNLSSKKQKAKDQFYNYLKKEYLTKYAYQKILIEKKDLFSPSEYTTMVKDFLKIWENFLVKNKANKKMINIWQAKYQNQKIQLTKKPIMVAKTKKTTEISHDPLESKYRHYIEKGKMTNAYNLIFYNQKKLKKTKIIQLAKNFSKDWDKFLARNEGNPKLKRWNNLRLKQLGSFRITINTDFQGNLNTLKFRHPDLGEN